MAVFGSGHGISTLIPAALSTDLYNIYVAKSRFQKSTKNSPVITGVQEESRENLFQNFDLDLAVIAVPPYEQLELARILVNNSKNIYIEKPAGVNSFEAKQLEVLAKESNCNMFVGYQFRFDPGIQYWKKLILNSASISKVSINWHTVGNNRKNDIFNWRNYPSRGGGVRTNFLVHVIDYLFYIFGQDQINNRSQWVVLENNLNSISVLCVGSIEIEINISSGTVKNSYWEIGLYNSKDEIFIKHSAPFTNVDYTSNDDCFLKTLSKTQIATDVRVQSTAILFAAIGLKIKQGAKNPSDLPNVHDSLMVHNLIEGIFNSTT